jgi:lysophospholipase L1-like esterase
VQAADVAPATKWVGTWASSQQPLEPKDSLPAEGLRNSTLRQIVRLSIGGSRFRLRISNAFGTAPLQLSAVHVARAQKPGSSRIDAASDRPLTFNERREVTVPAGAEYLSDPIDYPLAPRADLAVTLQIVEAPQQQTGHPGSRTTSYLAPGAMASALELQKAQRIDRWFFFSGVEVLAPAGAAAIVVLGDSITDGRGSTTNGNDRWPDVLAERLQRNEATRSLAVLNAGIGGNRLLLDGNGPNAMSRVARDVLSQSGVRYLIVFEGINDIGELTRAGAVSDARHEALVRDMIGGYRQIVMRARAHGIKVIGATLGPFAGFDYYHPGVTNELDRQVVNAWIRAPGNFDAVLDFEKVLADPQRPDRLRAEYDSGDHLHPSPAGYRALAEAVPLALFQ